jgi:membrane-associated phospholipid phosphatase
MRSHRTIVCVLLCSAALAHPARGESPYERSWSKDGWIAGLTVAGAVGAIAVGKTPSPLTAAEVDALSRESVNEFDRSATYRYSESIEHSSDVLIFAVVTAPCALLAGERVRNDWETFSLMYAETIALASIPSAYTKDAVERIRPYAYNPDVPMDVKTTSEAKKSFFSRHASIAFASAVFLSTVYNDYYPDSRAGAYVWAGSLLAASAVAYGRYASGQHFPTDLITGALVGGAVGYLVPRLHRIHRGNASLAVAPVAGSPIGLALEMKW